MQINNWSDLLANKRLSKTVRDENNDLIILGTQTKATFKKQDQWQPYAMTFADLAAAIGGGSGVSFLLEAGNFIQIEENGAIKSGPFIPAENSEITISAISVPNGLRWRGDFNSPTTGTTFEINDVVYTNLGSPTLYQTWFALQAQPVAGATAPPTTGYSNTYWGQLGVQGTKGTNGATIHQGTATPPPAGTGIVNDYYFNTTTKILYGPKLVITDWTNVVETNLSGDDGLNTATVMLYAKNNTPSIAPIVTTSGSTSINFTTGAITDTPSGWTTTIPATADDVLWVIQQYASANTDTDTLPNSNWSTPRILSQKGAQGDAATITLAPTQTVNYGTPASVTNLGSSSAAQFEFTIPSGPAATITPGTATALASGATPTVTMAPGGTPSAAIFNFGIPAGQAGQRTAVLTLYKWVNSATAPTSSFPSGSATYTWSSALWNTTGVTTPNGWSTTIGAPTKGWYLYKIDTVVTDNTTLPTSTVTLSGSPTVQFVSYAGADGGAVIDVSTAEQSASYTVLATDASKLIRFNTGASTTITVTVGTLAGMQNGSQVMFTWSAGTGGTVVFAGAGIKSPNSMLNLRTLYSSATLVKLADNSFYLVGDLAPY